MCDASVERKCEHRAWDHKIGLDVASGRSSHVGRCVQCGKRHPTLFDFKRCQISHEVRKALEQKGRWSDEGSREHLSHESMPPTLKAFGWKEVRQGVLARDGSHCQECNKPLAGVPTWFTEVHHILARERGGGDHPSNLKTLCLVCHRAHTNELLAQLWLEAIIDASIVEAKRKQLDLDHFSTSE